jgi:hypothetical protein
MEKNYPKIYWSLAACPLLKDHGNCRGGIIINSGTTLVTSAGNTGAAVRVA